MRHHPKFLLLFLSLFIAACSQGAKFDTLAGEPVSLAGNGKWQVINYWASWCTPCREEIPELNHFSRKYADTVSVYALNYDGLSGSELHKAATDMGIAFDSLLSDPAATLGWQRPTVLPTTVIIAPDGQVSGIYSGPQTLAMLAEYTKQETTSE